MLTCNGKHAVELPLDVTLLEIATREKIYSKAEAVLSWIPGQMTLFGGKMERYFSLMICEKLSNNKFHEYEIVERMLSSLLLSLGILCRRSREELEIAPAGAPVCL